MDTTKAITHVSLCAGYGGIDIGLKRAIPNLRTIAFSEIEAFACANLVSKMEAGLLDAAPIWTDLKTFPWSEFRDRVDILSGGYPCQPFSAAGKRQGADDPRHLWPYIADGVIRMRPRVCFFENVEGHISLGLSSVISDLEEMGYSVSWGIFSAAECGAPHQRKRVFILAHRSSKGSQGREWLREAGAQRTSSGHPFQCSCSMALAGSLGSAAGIPRPQQGHEGIAGVSDNSCGEELGNAASLRSCGPSPNARTVGKDKSGKECGMHEFEGAGALPRHDAQPWPSRPGEQQFAWEPPRVIKTESALGRGFARNSNRMDNAELYTTCDNRTDELRLLGNGVVPATAERAFKILTKELYND